MSKNKYCKSNKVNIKMLIERHLKYFLPNSHNVFVEEDTNFEDLLLILICDDSSNRYQDSINLNIISSWVEIHRKPSEVLVDGTEVSFSYRKGYFKWIRSTCINAYINLLEKKLKEPFEECIDS